MHHCAAISAKSRAARTVILHAAAIVLQEQLVLVVEAYLQERATQDQTDQTSTHLWYLWCHSLLQKASPRDAKTGSIWSVSPTHILPSGRASCCSIQEFNASVWHLNAMSSYVIWAQQSFMLFDHNISQMSLHGWCRACGMIIPLVVTELQVSVLINFSCWPLTTSWPNKIELDAWWQPFTVRRCLCG